MTDIVFFLDFDNTLFDHDEFKRRIGEWLDENPDSRGSAAFWSVYEEVRATTGVVDIPLTVKRYAACSERPEFEDEFQRFIWHFPYRELVFPGARDAVQSLNEFGMTVILCDGSDRHQRHKIRQTGFHQLVSGRIHVFGHKERHIAGLRDVYPAPQYVMVDDKPRIHEAVKAALGAEVVTVLVEQGHYALSSEAPLAVDVRVQNIGDIVKVAAQRWSSR